MRLICPPLEMVWRTIMALAMVLAALMSVVPALAQGGLSRQQALQALNHSDPAQRLVGLLRLADVGAAEDGDAVLARLHDPDATVRRVATPAIWRLWGRSGDPTIDLLYEQGVALMQSGDLPKAVLVFTGIIAKRPAFAEAWNKRATLYFMLDQYDLSMKDCDEVLKRIPKHFGALSGYAQMLVERGQLERSLEMLERAYRVNPNMGNADLMIQDLKQRIEEKRKKST